MKLIVDTFEYVFKEFKSKNKSSLKILSAACSSGQEPYAISMVADEFMKKNLATNMKFGTMLTESISNQ